jgi:Domain of unknown function (DUF1989)
MTPRDAGLVRRSVLVPPKSGRAIQIRAGEIVDVIDIDGNQVGGLWAIDAVDHRRWLSTSHTRDKLERLLPFVGESFVDQQYDPILEVVADTSPGIHDMLFPACNPALYAREGLAGLRQLRRQLLGCGQNRGRRAAGATRSREPVPELKAGTRGRAHRTKSDLAAGRQRVAEGNAGCDPRTHVLCSGLLAH